MYCTHVAVLCWQLQEIGLRQHGCDQVTEQQLANQHECQESHEGLVVASTHAVAQHRAMVIETLHTAPAAHSSSARQSEPMGPAGLLQKHLACRYLMHVIGVATCTRLQGVSHYKRNLRLPYSSLYFLCQQTAIYRTLLLLRCTPAVRALRYSAPCKAAHTHLHIGQCLDLRLRLTLHVQQWSIGVPPQADPAALLPA